MPNFYKTGNMITSEFIETNAMDTYGNPTAAFEYTPTTATNSTCGYYNWYTPEGTIAGDRFRVSMTVEYEGFDRSNPNGTFNIYFHGSRYDTESDSWTWSGGSSSICDTLSGLANIVLSSTKGTYTFDVSFAIPADNVTRYTGQKVGIRSNYSNGTAHIKFYNFKVIPEKYYTDSTTSQRFANNYIATQEFIEL